MVEDRQMGLGRNIQTIRENRGFTQEQLAFHFNLPTETIVAWEEETISPALDVIVEIALFLQVNVDELVCGEYIPPKKKVITQSSKNTAFQHIHNHTHVKVIKKPKASKNGIDNCEEVIVGVATESDIKEYNSRHYEYRSKLSIFQYPLVHINIGTRMYEAKGIIAIGNIARGIVCLGLYAFGFLSLGILSIGLISLGALTLGGISIGGVAIGYISVGGVAIGVYACGYLALASRIAVGYDARGYVAVGSKVQAMFGLLTNSETNTTMICEYLLRQGVPEFIARFLLLFI